MRYRQTDRQQTTYSTNGSTLTVGQ